MRTSIAALRWLAVLPAAILAWWVVSLACGYSTAVLARLFPESMPFDLRLLLYYPPKVAAFVVVGGKVAPRSVPTAIALAMAAIAASLTVHILGQRTVGTTNYLHFAAESAGALLGMLCIYGTRPTPAAESLRA